MSEPRRVGSVGTSGLAGISPDLRPQLLCRSNRTAKRMAALSVELQTAGALTPQELAQKMDLLIRLIDMRFKEMEGPSVTATLRERLLALWRRFRG